MSMGLNISNLKLPSDGEKQRSIGLPYRKCNNPIAASTRTKRSPQLIQNPCVFPTWTKVYCSRWVKHPWIWVWNSKFFASWKITARHHRKDGFVFWKWELVTWSNKKNTKKHSQDMFIAWMSLQSHQMIFKDIQTAATSFSQIILKHPYLFLRSPMRPTPETTESKSISSSISPSRMLNFPC